MPNQKGGAGAGASARLFDADRVDREVELGAETAKSVGDRQLLWIDLIVSGDPDEIPIPLEWLPFDPAALARAWSSAPSPRLSVHGDYFLARLVVLHADKQRDSPEVLDLAVAKNVVLTAHRKPIKFLADLDNRITADTSLGEIDSGDFASVLLDGLITSYLERTDEILARIDELDGEALRPQSSGDLLSELVALRHRIAATRRALVAHRTVMGAIAGADFELLTRAKAGPRFVGVTERFNAAVDAIDAAREALIGTFDIYMSRTAQRTNDVMKILTITSVLLLPTGAIAGFMGMNTKPPFSNDDPIVFWIVVVLIVAVALVTLLLLRVRRWL
jgi:magnesium transporter